MSLLQKGMAALSNKNSRLKQLYPAVNELETPFPTCWSHKDKHEFIGLSEDGLTINYKGNPCTVPFIQVSEDIIEISQLKFQSLSEIF